MTAQRDFRVDELIDERQRGLGVAAFDQTGVALDRAQARMGERADGL